jgi:hypothetical protein
MLYYALVRPNTGGAQQYAVKDPLRAECEANLSNGLHPDTSLEADGPTCSPQNVFISVVKNA